MFPAAVKRLLVSGARAVLLRSKTTQADPWLISLLGREPRLIAAVAAAIKTARVRAVVHCSFAFLVLFFRLLSAFFLPSTRASARGAEGEST